jgi:ribosomal-protein-alanine N-acetyltransferase
VYLRFPTQDDAKILLEFGARNNQSMDPIQDRLSHQEGRSCRFLIFLKDDPDQLAGFINFTQIFRGPFQACYVGYALDKKREGQGIMFEAMQIVIGYAFNELKLHRIMANYMPSNVRSANLLKRLGFEIEGFAKKYLYINGKWENHVLTSKTNPTPIY